ncbi:MAG: GNAT family N-acetyltransferase [Chloroflexota bacterium]
MTDMLVKLYGLPPIEPLLSEVTASGVTIRRGIAPEKHVVLDWVEEHFSEFWRSECDIAYCRVPVSCFVAVEAGTLLGFACYDSTSRGFFGPTGVHPEARGRSLGKVLLLACLHDMAAQGYGYAIIGSVGPVEFYQKYAGAILIPDSTPGIYAGMLHRKSSDTEA